MPRKGRILSQKKQAPKDFAKVTNKVGKKKKAPINDTKTDFKVKQVQMPSQSALGEKGEEVTHRRLGLAELLAHAQHHSAKVRRDAFDGLHELCNSHAGVLNTSVARILDATAMSAIDSSADVREAFRKFQSWLIEALPVGALAAFAPTLALHVRSALSHVSAEVRDDGLLLLELYASRLGSEQVLSQTEAARIVEILCQLASKTDAVLRCLYRLHRHPAEPRASSSILSATHMTQLSLQDVLRGRLGGVDNEGGTAESTSVDAAGDTQADSAVWGFCLRAWLQAGELVSSGGRLSEAAEKPGWVKLHCAAVLERALEEANLEASALGGAAAPSTASLRPSSSQIATLAGVVRRGEWPVQVDKSSSLRPLADSINLRMARVMGLLTTGGVAAEGIHLTRLARAALNFLEDFNPSSSSSATGTAAAAAAAIDHDAELSTFSGTSGAAYALRTLDLLWAGFAMPATELQRPPLGHEEMPRLVSVTARFLSGGLLARGDAAVTGSAAILAIPLAAALLGLRPGAAIAADVSVVSGGSAQGRAPASVRPAWPSALVACGEPSFAEVIEKSLPGTAALWVSAWPKMLWYLGSLDPALSTFLLALLLELAKQASYRGGALVEQLLAESVCPLLVPFLTGTSMPGAEVEEAPPLARLPRGLTGAQGLAAALLPHFPRLSEPFVGRLAWLICRWSDVGLCDTSRADAAAPVGLGIDCCELILQALLHGDRLKSASGPLQVRLRIALTVLVATPRHSPTSAANGVRAETAALHLVDAVAEWLMSETTSLSGICAVDSLSLDDRRRLALQSFAWPLCAEAFASSPSCASRALCFLFFCAARLPQGHAAVDACNEGADGQGKSADLGWRAFLCQVFRGVMSCDHGRALRADSHGRAAAIFGSLCDPVRGSGASHAALLESEAVQEASDAEASRRLGQLFVQVWMRAVAPPQRPAAYELLVKLCAQGLLSASAASQQSRDMQPGVAISAHIVILVAAISYRNESGLSIEGWGSTDLATAAGFAVAHSQRKRDELQSELTACARQLHEEAASTDLMAMLPLL